ncbi:MAG: hypothetical protein IKV36_03610 [Clostridia bacterium]|nr:hypothetical protein [Clostridia bacterium]
MQHHIDMSSVVKVFKSLSGLDATQDKCAVICKSAANTISRLIKPDCDVVAEMPRITFAAAALAYYRFTLTDEINGVTGFSAGDISIDCSNGGSSAAKVLYEQAMSDISDLLIEKRFAFRRV